MADYGRRFGCSLLVSVALLLAWYTPTPATRHIHCKSAAEVITKKVPYKVEGLTPQSAKRVAQKASRSRGWHAGKEWKCLVNLWERESGWRHDADNPRSTAYGIAQMLNTPKSLTPTEQIARGLQYITARYRTPCNAWLFWQRHHWY